MKLTWEACRLPLKHEFRISRGSYTEQPTLVVQLEQQGCRGYGEATTDSYYGHTIESLSDSLREVQPIVEENMLDDPADLWSQLAPLLRNDLFALAAIDLAAHDLWGKLRNRPIFELWGLSDRPLPRSCITIGIAEIDQMLARLGEYADWPIVKIKLGSPDDLQIVRQLRAGSEATFRVDANGGWTLDQALRLAEPLQSLGVEFIEQPLPVELNHEMPTLAACCPLPILADESCQVENDVATCHDLRFQGINIKTVKCGGLTPARRMILLARQRGLSVMIGCMTESSIGVSGAAQLLPLVDYADLDGPALIGQDVATGVSLTNGTIGYASDERGYLAGSGIERIGSQ